MWLIDSKRLIIKKSKKEEENFWNLKVILSKKQSGY